MKTNLTLPILSGRCVLDGVPSESGTRSVLRSKIQDQSEARKAVMLQTAVPEIKRPYHRPARAVTSLTADAAGQTGQSAGEEGPRSRGHVAKHLESRQGGTRAKLGGHSVL